jgi:D-arginine dehydrogenase
VVVLEAERSLGVHSSGRSAAHSHFGIGDAIVRQLTAASRDALLQPDAEGHAAAELQGALFVANEAMLPDLADLRARVTEHADPESVGEAELRELCPLLRIGDTGAVAGLYDRTALKLDADRMLQHAARGVRARGGQVITGAEVASIDRVGQEWIVGVRGGSEFKAPVIVNGAGAWADRIATLAGVPPVGLKPLRRTMIGVDHPVPASLPFTKTARDELYFLASGGALLASPVDEHPSAAIDAAPEEEDVAIAADRLERWTTVTVRRIAHCWAGLRTFAADRVPVVGWGEDGFFWLAGQGGIGLQTAPALAAAASALITDRTWPYAGIDPAALAPDRLINLRAS